MASTALSEAQALIGARQYDRAAALLRRAAQKEPNSPEVNHLLGFALYKAGQHEQSQYFFERAVRLAPRSPAVHNNFANLLIRTRRFEQAAAHLRAAIAADEGYFPAYPNLVTALMHGQAIIPACDLALGALARFPDRVELVGAAATALMLAGRIDECIAVVRAARQRLGNSVALQTMLMLPLNYSHTLTAREVFDEHVEMGRIIAASHPPDARAHANTPDPERPLRIGYISQDFRNRSAAHFIEPILAQHDRAAFRAFCYYSGSEADEMTARLRASSAGWAEVAELSDRALADRIRADAIDIAVDLTGHTGGNRLPALSFKPAPVQVTYMGYPNTTGLGAIDYRIVDAATDPPGSERLATETLVRLAPCFLCYAPPPHAPEVAPCPAPGAGHVTFGSFNTYAKMSPPCVDLWSRLLTAVPGSRLLLKNMALGDPTVAEHTRGLFAQRGIGPERLELRGETASKSEHMGAYAQVDIALDPFPYNGTTTSVEALWMGVPVVVLAGSTHVSRVGMSLMNVLGLGDLVGASTDEYLRIATELAGNSARLADLRASLRERVRRSALCDAAGFTKKYEGALREMWRTWCVESAEREAKNES